MPIGNIVILSAIVLVFTLFAVVLAYVDRIAARRPEPDGHPAE